MKVSVRLHLFLQSIPCWIRRFALVLQPALGGARKQPIPGEYVPPCCAFNAKNESTSPDNFNLNFCFRMFISFAWFVVRDSIFYVQEVCLVFLRKS